MSVRRPNLEEWFMRHQLLAIQRRHVHLPVSASVDVTALAKKYGPKPPWTALVVRAVIELAARVPEINRMYFDTWIGGRIVEPPYVAVNVPVILLHEGVPHLSAAIVRGGTLEEIQGSLKGAREQRLSELPIGRLFIRNENTWWNRMKLRLIHHVVWHFPWLYLKKGGGGLSVSSLMLHNKSDIRAWAPSYGPTCFTVCITGVEEKDGKSELHLGIGFDHGVLAGERAAYAVAVLSEILSAA